VSTCVVEVGPAAVRGPRAARRCVVEAALECLDDDIAIVDEAAVAVDALWREVFRTVLPNDCVAAALVCPGWWPAERLERIRRAATTATANVTVARRADVLAGGAAGTSTIVEVAPEVVVVTRAGTVVAATPRLGRTSDIARSVVSHIDRASTVLVDAPPGVAGATETAAAITDLLRPAGVSAVIADLERVRRAADLPRPRREFPPDPPRWAREKPAAVAGLGLSLVVASVCVALVIGGDRTPPASNPVTSLVEGRVALNVPALWSIRRITSGAGSARVEVTAPDGSMAVLVTQARVQESETLAATAVALRAALDDQDADVFGAFDADGRRADRPVVTYREVRGARQIDWSVMVDGAVRIAVGCQSAPDAEDSVRDVCDEAIRSAHAIF
jgi:type VII secretion-associated protein (TIGR03931 family)